MNNKLHRCFICAICTCMYVYYKNKPSSKKSAIYMFECKLSHKIGKREVFDINIRFVYPFGTNIIL